MKYIVTEGYTDAELLKAIFRAVELSDFRFSVAGGRSFVISFAKSILVSRRLPVAVVIDADTTDARHVRELERTYFDLLHSVSGGVPFKILVAAPTLDVVCFSYPDVLRRTLGVQLSESELQQAKFKPTEVLLELMKKAGIERPRSWFRRLDKTSALQLAHHPLIRSLIEFVKQPTTEVPDGSGPHATRYAASGN